MIVTMFPFFPQGDPTYLIVKNDGGIENYGLNAVCTHLGCVVPWVGVSTCLALGLGLFGGWGSGDGWCGSFYSTQQDLDSCWFVLMAVV